MKEFERARSRAPLTVGESVRLVRELQETTRRALADATGIPQSTIAAIERDAFDLDIGRAKRLGRALDCHPAVLLFPGWEPGTPER